MKNLKTVLKNVPQVENFVSSKGNNVPNQFRIITKEGSFFQSYSTIIAAKLNDGRILLDERRWDYSRTTGKYRNNFLGMDKKEAQDRIDKGEIKLVDLNA